MDVRLWWQWPTWSQQQPQLHQKSSWISCWSWSRYQYGCLWIQSYSLRFQRWLDHLVIRWWGSRKIRTWPLYIKRLVCCSNCRLYSFLATTSTNLTKLIISLSVIKTFNNLGEQEKEFFLLKIIFLFPQNKLLNAKLVKVDATRGLFIVQEILGICRRIVLITRMIFRYSTNHWRAARQRHR